VKPRKWKHIFIKNNITGDVNMTRRDIQTFISLMMSTISNEGTLLKMKSKLMAA
jgi:hypothetical protein